MRVPIRKPGKYTHDKADPFITETRYNELKAKLEKFKKNIRPPLIAEVKRLAMMGDFSDNAAYSIAKGQLRGLNQRILETEDLLKRAEIIKTGEKNDYVRLGHFVTIESNNKIKTYQILGSTEVNLNADIISHNSPIGSALMGRRVGEVIKIKLAKKEVEYKILKIRNNL